MDKLDSVASLIISQKKNWSEIITGFEAANKYSVLDDSGNTLYVAAEWPGSFLVRIMLKAIRPFTIYVMQPDGTRVLILKRTFRFYFHKMEILDPDWNLQGTILRRFSFLRRVYSVQNNSGHEILQLLGPILHPWTFIIRISEREIGRITKKWSGFLKEAFTNADNFGITFPPDMDTTQKSLLLGAVFLIDFVHFEKRGND